MGRRSAARKPEEASVSRFASQHGDYRREPMPVTQGELGAERAGNVTVLRNRTVTTVERWKLANFLSQPQTEAIELYHRAWSIALGEQRTTMNWSLTASIRGIPAHVLLATRFDARDTLSRIDDILTRLPNGWADVWQNVILFDEPLGVVGSRLGYESRKGETQARKICQFIADKIAELMRL